MGLPPGQTAGHHRRFGLPWYATVRPQLSSSPVITVKGMDAQPTRIPIAELMALESRRTQRSDLHCVTTWSARSLDWEGVPFRDFHELCGSPSADWVCFIGLDGYRACLRLDDALADDVLLADRLDGRPLGFDHGAPVRLVAPAHYGYKSVKHLTSIRYRETYDPGPAGFMAHPRGRVDREERSRFLPGPLWRPVWRAALPAVRKCFERASE